MLTVHDVWPRPSGASILVIDAEGTESLILGRGILPHPAPRLILFEHAHLSTEDQGLIHRNLVRQGYVKLEDLRHRDRAATSRNDAAQDRLYGLTYP